MNGNRHEKKRFTNPASNGGDPKDCVTAGHIPSGPARRRVCLRCGVALCGDRRRSRECTGAPHHDGDHRQVLGVTPLGATTAMEWPPIVNEVPAETRKYCRDQWGNEFTEIQTNQRFNTVRTDGR